MRRAGAVLLLPLILCCYKAARRPAAQVATRESILVSAAAPPPQQASASNQPATVASLQRMIIRNANVSMVVRNAVDALQKISALVDAKGGYLAETKQWKENEQIRASATLRVPATQLTSTLAAIRTLAVRVESESITAQDVSQEYSDLGAQLRNLQAAETELRELLRTVRQRTQKASEIMEIYSEITKVRGDIDRIQTRLQYLSQMTELSTITIELIPDALAVPLVEPGWRPMATIKSATRALVSTMKLVVDALIWIGLYVLPLALVLTVVVAVARAIFVKFRRPPAS